MISPYSTKSCLRRRDDSRKSKPAKPSQLKVNVSKIGGRKKSLKKQTMSSGSFIYEKECRLITDNDYVRITLLTLG
jgi:hypothetical protein